MTAMTTLTKSITARVAAQMVALSPVTSHDQKLKKSEIQEETPCQLTQRSSAKLLPGTRRQP